MKQKLVVIGAIGLLCASMLTGCGTSEEAKYVIDKINTIGEVDFDDEALIGECEDAYVALTDEQKAEVSNVETLAKAREKMDELIASRPIPFSTVNWETSKEELVSLLGNPDDEGDNEFYGHMMWYNDVQYEGYTGIAKYGIENGKVTRVFFAIDGYDENTVKYFEDLFTTKYGEPNYKDDYGNKRWDMEYVSCAISSSKLRGGLVNILFMSPVLGED